MIKILKIIVSYIIIFLVLLSVDILVSKNELFRVAHAGGSYQKETYTNSIDALNYNKDKYKLFEIDLISTIDGSVVCLHDWNNNFYKAFNRSTKLPLTLSEFQFLVKRNKKYKNCTFQTLVDWLDANPDKIIITDVKDDNIKILSYISSHYQNFSKRFIPQIYQPEEYSIVKKMGYSKIIWTLYRFNGSSADVLQYAKGMDLYAITIPESRAKEGLAINLKEKLGISSYVHTVNSRAKYLFFKIMGIDEIYTDSFF